MNCGLVLDSRMTLAEAIAGTLAPDSVRERLCLLDVRYFSFDNRLHQGQLVLHRDVRQDILALFHLLEELRFPVARVVPIVQYGWSDDASMQDNNSSAFNYRFIAGTKRLSAHARGMAVDINPLLNPVIYPDGRVSPPGARYLPGGRGVLTEQGPVVREFLKRGWQWGGQIQSFKDYHHFECKAQSAKCKTPTGE